VINDDDDDDDGDGKGREAGSEKDVISLGNPKPQRPVIYTNQIREQKRGAGKMEEETCSILSFFLASAIPSESIMYSLLLLLNSPPSYDTT